MKVFLLGGLWFCIVMFLVMLAAQFIKIEKHILDIVRLIEVKVKKLYAHTAINNTK